MPRFNVGDRVRRTSPFGGHSHIVVGSVYTIQRTVADLVYLENERGGLYDSRFELVEAAPPLVQMQEITFYSVVYQADPAAIKEIRGFETMASYERFKLSLQRVGGIVLATKKIKTNIPVVEN